MIVEGEFTPIHTAGRTEREHRPGVEQDYEQGQSLFVTLQEVLHRPSNPILSSTKRFKKLRMS